jgi:two-component system, OmpR family, sensor histidine kinase KdpD
MSTEPSRLDPDELLSHVQSEEQQNKRGRLKIFLGYAAGVGKTYAMLEAAHQRKAEGVDVVVGYVETHGREETQALLVDLEVIPRWQIIYRSIQLPEMDIDAILQRTPQLALVDELAHSNVPGSRHAKRYQDIEELLNAGIDVYTTLNIQHIESLNDVITQITGIVVRETVPDSVIDDVSDIELVDLPPDELINRLQEGKVYIPDQARRAIQKFFRKGNLTALRELSMRRAAERVDDQMRAYMQTRAIQGPWSVSEHLLVCISPGALGERLVRTGRRLADELKADWIVLYVETPNQVSLSQAQRDKVANLLKLADEIGARTITLPGQSVAKTVMDYAHRHNITKVIVGKPIQPAWRELIRGSVVNQIIRLSEATDVYVISSEAESESGKFVKTIRPHRPWARYLDAILLVIAASVISELILSDISPTNLVMIFLLAVVIAAVYLGRGPAILTSILGVLVFDFFFVPPYLTLAVSDTEYLLTFLGLLSVSLVISQLMATVREQAEAAQHREMQTIALYELGRDLTITTGLENVAQTVISRIDKTFDRTSAIFLPVGGILKAYATSPGLVMSEDELAVANWTFKHGQVAGQDTATLPEASMHYQPLKTQRGVVGVFGIQSTFPNQTLNRDQARTLDAFANQIAVAFERARLDEQARQAELLQITEKLQSALLNSISHDLRTPLASITGALSSLLEDEVTLNEAARRSLIETASEEADRLNRLVGNLLDMTRLEAGAMHVKSEDCDIQDVIGVTLEELGVRLVERSVKIDIPHDLPLIPMDFVLIERVLSNVIDNALKYSPSETPIEISVRMDGGYMKIRVIDQGVGIPPEDFERVFDKFYRVQRPGNVSGTGLGLAISKGIVEAHGGTISAENNPGGGTLITITLPQEERK